MPVYAYRARRSSGELTTGQLDAPSREAAVAALQEQGLLPSQVDELAAARTVGVARREVTRPSFAPPRISAMSRAAFWTAGSQAMRAGLPLGRLLDLWAQGSHGKLSRFAREIQPDVLAGTPFSTLMAARRDLFGPLEVGLVRAGEASGRLDETMARLAVGCEREMRLRQSLRGPLAYLGCLGFTFASSMTVVFVVAPAIGARSSGEPTHIVSSLLRLALPVLVLAGLVFAARAGYVSSRGLREMVDQLKIRVPILRGVFLRLALARFAQALGELVAGGVPLGEGVELAVAATGNLWLTARLAGVPDQLRAGVPLSAALAATGQFPPQVIQMIVTGEESGTVDQMLAKVSDYYDSEAAAATQQLTVLGTAAVFGLMAIGIGLFVIQFFLGYLGQVNQLLQ